MKSFNAVVFILAGVFFFCLPTIAKAGPTSNAERRLWQTAAQEQVDFEARVLLLQAPGLRRYLDGVAGRLWNQAHTDLPEMTFRVIQEPAADAFTYPNGVCYLTTGMLVRLSNESQLAMVMAHEMIHYLQRHTLRAENRLYLGFGQGPANQAAGPGEYESASFLSRAEMQADREGFDLMVKAGYCPGQIVGLLKAIGARHAAGTDRPGIGAALAGAPDRFKRFKDMIARQQTGEQCTKPATGDLYIHHMHDTLLANTRIALQRGLWREAGESLARLLNAYPDDPRTYFLQGELLRRSQRQDTAQSVVRAYRRAIDLDRTFTPALRALGVLHMKAGRYEPARTLFETYLALSPECRDRAYIEGYLKLCDK